MPGRLPGSRSRRPKTKRGWSPDGTRLLSLVIADGGFHVGVLDAVGTDPPVVFDQSYGASWQPVAVPLPPAPSFAASPPAP